MKYKTQNLKDLNKLENIWNICLGRKKSLRNVGFDVSKFSIIYKMIQKIVSKNLSSLLINCQITC